MVLGLIRAIHPQPAAAVVVVAGLLALAVGHPPGPAALVALTVAASQLAVGWTNDAVDAPRDAAVGRTDKPTVTGQVSRRTVAVAAGLAAAATVPLALSFGPRAGVVGLAALAGGLAYDWPLKLTVLSPLPYAVAFAALPAFVVLAVPASPPAWLVAAGGLLGTGAHFANALPDLADDAATGVRGLPHRLGATGSRLAAAGLLLAATVVLVLGPPGPPSWVGLAALLAAAVVLPAGLSGAEANRRGRSAGDGPGGGWYAASRATGRPIGLFRAFIVVALIDVGLLLAGGTVL